MELPFPNIVESLLFGVEDEGEDLSSLRFYSEEFLRIVGEV